jgi:hypothetical protein
MRIPPHAHGEPIAQGGDGFRFETGTQAQEQAQPLPPPQSQQLPKPIPTQPQPTHAGVTQRPMVPLPRRARERTRTYRNLQLEMPGYESKQAWNELEGIIVSTKRLMYKIADEWEDECGEEEERAKKWGRME